MTTQPPIIILENLRSAMNVGSIIRSAACFGVKEIWSIGTTPYTDLKPLDTRLPHIVRATQSKITKTSLGAEKFVRMHHAETLDKLLELTGSDDNFLVFERTLDSIPLTELKSNPQAEQTYWLFGNEVSGVSQQAINRATTVVAIDQTNHKESLNVAVSAAVAMYSQFVQKR